MPYHIFFTLSIHRPLLLLPMRLKGTLVVSKNIIVNIKVYLYLTDGVTSYGIFTSFVNNLSTQNDYYTHSQRSIGGRKRRFFDATLLRLTLLRVFEMASSLAVLIDWRRAYGASKMGISPSYPAALYSSKRCSSNFGSCDNLTGVDKMILRLFNSCNPSNSKS